MKRLLLLPLIAAAAWGQGAPPPTPAITGLNAYLVTGGGPGGAAVTAGVGGQAGIILQITGSGFLPPVFFSEVAPLPTSVVQWISSSGTFDLAPSSGDTTQLVVGIPGLLIAQPGSVFVKVFNPNGGTSGPAAFVVNPFPLARSLPNGTVGVAYLQDLITGGTGPFTVQPPSGTLPPPLQLSAAPPRISGTPNAAGAYTFGTTITDSWGQGLNGSFSVAIAAAPVITPVTPPRGTVGVFYSLPLSVTGGNTPFTWSISSGSLPPGLSFLDTRVTTIGGTPTTPGTYPFTLKLTEQAGGTTTLPLTIFVDSPLTVVTQSLPAATWNAPYSQAIQVSGGFPPYTWQVPEGSSLPQGLTLNSSTGVISGTPTTLGFYSFQIFVNDSNSRSAVGSYGLLVQPPPLTITTASPLPAAIAGVSYTSSFSATGGIPPYGWTLASGSTLPPGLTLTSAGVLSGIPTAKGTYTFGITVSGVLPGALGAATAGFTRDALRPAANGSGPVTASFTLVVQPTNLTITSSPPDGRPGVPYSAQMSAAGATPPYTWSIVTGSLPQGLTMNSAGLISGAPLTVTGTTFTLQVTDYSGQTAARQFYINLTPPIPDLTIATTSLPNGTVGAAYLTVVGASGGEPPYAWTLTGLPPGLSADSLGAIKGTPTQFGSFTVGVSVTDTGSRRAAGNLTLQIDPALLVITTGLLPDGALNQAYSAAFAATGGVPPLTWSLAGGALPQGLALVNGVLSGTPTAVGAFDFSVSVIDSKQKSASKAFHLNVPNTVLTVTTGSLPDGMAGSVYSAALAATGGTPPYKWSAGGLPAGLGVDANGTIAGTPSVPGTATVSVTVTDSKGVTANKSLGLTIRPAGLRITTTSVPDGVLGAPYSLSFAAAGGVPPYGWALTAGYAGSGLTFSSDGALSGQPLETGAFTIGIQVTDSSGKTDAKVYTFNVSPASLVITTASPLPAGTVGTAYARSFAVSGDVAPVTWSATGLPAGLSLSSGGVLSGTPSAPGTFTLNVQAVEASNRVAGRTASGTFVLTVGLPPLPAPTFGGVPDTSNPGQQPTLTLGLSGTYPLPITGTVTLTFTPLSGPGDPAVQFSTGGLTVQFTIPAGANLATFPAPSLGVQTGTVAGTITLTTTFQAGGRDITPSPTPTRIIRVNTTAPVITAVTATRTTAGFDVQVTGYSSTREVSSATFTFIASSSGSLGTTQQVVTIGPQFAAWFQGTASAPFGSRFTFVQSFNVTGSSSAIATVGVTLTNSVGISSSVTANLQ